MEDSEREKIKAIARFLVKARSILFITGAGVSAESGLPTYRGLGGLYDSAAVEEGVSIETALSGKTFELNPRLTWKYINQIEEACRFAEHNRAHQIIAFLEECFERVWVLTQNIDGFHQKAGSKNVIDIHGDLHTILCKGCGWRITVPNYRGLSVPPLCVRCGGVTRPDIVLFGELLPEEKCVLLANELRRGFDIYFSIGTSGVFPYIQEPILDALRRDRMTVEINPQETELSKLVQMKVSLKATDALEKILSVYETLQEQVV